MRDFLRKYYLYILLGVSCFLAGAYIWRVANTGTKQMDFSSAESFPSRSSVLVEVGRAQITSEDLDFEYSLHTRGVFADEDLTPIPDLGARFEKELEPLKAGLLSSLIERKLLFQHLSGQEKFRIDDPKRFTVCLAEWQETVAALGDWLDSVSDRERLKGRLCEKSIIDQYLAEVVYPKIQITDNQVAEYYSKHKQQFKKPKRVTIRQIVLPSEKAAKKARHGLTRHNFATRAQELSITPEAKNGGKLGPFAKGELPRVFDVAFSMRRGDIYGILKSTYGFHLIMLEKKLSAVEPSLEEATPAVRTIILRLAKERELQAWIERALDTIEVKSSKPLW